MAGASSIVGGIVQTEQVALPYDRSRAETSAPKMVRPREGRVIAGVCAGLAEHLQVPVNPIRIVMVVLAFSGAGLVGYLMLWGLTPQEGEEGAPAPSLASAPSSANAPSPPAQATAPAPSALATARAGAVAPADVASPPRRPQAGFSPEARVTSGGPAPTNDGGVVLLVGVAVAVVGVIWWAQRAGFVRLGLLIPVIAIAAGAMIGLSQLDASQRGRWLGRPGSGWRAITRLGVGAAVTATGAVGLVSRGSTLRQTFDVGLATLVVLLGMALLIAPWAYRVWSDLRTEQAARARADERADIAAHLHDSVLQTLALIQRQSGDAPRVATLARAQERELRAWLYAGGPNAQASLADAVAAVIEEIEAGHGRPIDLVSTGNREMDESGQALVRALREALTNAATHGAPPISVYLEANASGVEAFVRDHGPGIDLGAIPDDRLGVRESIIGRMTRHGGSADVRRLDPGTEWTLTLPAPALEGAS